MIFLAIDWGSVGLKAAQLLLSLSILVILHEFGHYITARWFKCRVDKFYLFFDPWFSLFKKKVGETEYGIGWLPLGGYVKIAGMVDESLDKEQLSLPPQPWEFRSKPAWQRLIIMLGGVTVNVILAFIIYAMILMVWGEKKIPSDSLKYGIAFNDPLFKDLGFKQGDKILAVDGKPVTDYTETLKKLLIVNKEVTISREGKKMNLPMPVDLIGNLVEKRKKTEKPMISPRTPVLVLYVPDTANVYKAGLRRGDQIIAIDSVTTDFYDEFAAVLEKKKKGQSVSVTVKRNEATLSFNSVLPQDGLIGFGAPVSISTGNGIDDRLNGSGNRIGNQRVAQPGNRLPYKFDISLVDFGRQGRVFPEDKIEIVLFDSQNQFVHRQYGYRSVFHTTLFGFCQHSIDSR